MPSDICDSLLVWLGTFDAVDSKTFLPDELTDGLVLSSVLNQVNVPRTAFSVYKIQCFNVVFLVNLEHIICYITCNSNSFNLVLNFNLC